MIESSNKLKVIAVSAPQWIAHKGKETHKSLHSTDPFSLHNAFRIAAWNAQKGIGHWGKSNWINRNELKESVQLMNYFENEISGFIELINEKKPSLLFIGAMTLSYPGAIALAKCAKDILKENVFIVLGGKHCNETFWYNDNSFIHHNGSPLKNMAATNGIDQNIFDLVIAGDGEDVIVQIGEIIGHLLSDKRRLSDFYLYTHTLEQSKGKWVAGWVDASCCIHEIKSAGLPLNYDNMPIPADVFGMTDNFSVFEADITGHAYSDMSKGCVYDCYFCSERNRINGKTGQKISAPQRLYNQLQKIKEVGTNENKAVIVSAFVEDSIILSGDINLINQFNDLLTNKPLGIKWGCQLTIDGFLQQKMMNAVKKLKENGLMYILFGMETINENIALKLNKNIHKKEEWKNRNERVLDTMSCLGLKVGLTILWGLGEHQSDRINHLQTLKAWREKYGTPHVIGLNWAVKHPLKSENSNEHKYIDWGTHANSIYLELFIELFGEASERYNLINVETPPISEMQTLKKVYYDLISN